MVYGPTGKPKSERSPRIRVTPLVKQKAKEDEAKKKPKKD